LDEFCCRWFDSYGNHTEIAPCANASFPCLERTSRGSPLCPSSCQNSRDSNCRRQCYVATALLEANLSSFSQLKAIGPKAEFRKRTLLLTGAEPLRCAERSSFSEADGSQVSVSSNLC